MSHYLNELWDNLKQFFDFTTYILSIVVLVIEQIYLPDAKLDLELVSQLCLCFKMFNTEHLILILKFKNQLYMHIYTMQCIQLQEYIVEFVTNAIITKYGQSYIYVVDALISK